MPPSLHPSGPQVPRRPIAFRLVHELEGLLHGIRADGVIHPLEMARLRTWLDANAPFASIAPFKELAQRVEHALSDGVLTTDEVDDLLFVCGNLTTVNPHYDALRSGVQTLMGLFASITADHQVNEQELESLQLWLERSEHLMGLWPYDECASIVTAAMSGMLLPTHVEAMRELARQFPIGGAEIAGDAVPTTVRGICAVDPTLRFDGKTYVFTGESARADRARLFEVVERLGGRPEENVTKRTDYLVICAEGSNFWAFSCYGRKVEKAYNQRRAGHHVLLVHEVDFWDALVV